MNKETLLETKLSANAVSRRITIQQTFMPLTGITVTVTRLLRENFRVLLSVAVSFCNYGVGKLLRVEHSWQRFRAIQTVEESRNSRSRVCHCRICHLGAGLMGRV